MRAALISMIVMRLLAGVVDDSLVTVDSMLFGLAGILLAVLRLRIISD